MKDSKNIYEYLNQMDFNIEDYNKEILNDIEKKELKKAFRKNIKRKINFRKVASMAAALILGLAIFSQTNLGKEVYAIAESKVSQISYSIGKALGLNKNIEPYTNVVGEVKEDNGIEVKLEEVIVDKDRIIFNTIFNTTRPVENVRFKDIKVYINGEKVDFSGSNMRFSSLDDTDTLFSFLCYYDVKGIEQMEDLEIKLELEDLKYYIGDFEGIEEGKWEFEFTANGKELAVETHSISFDYTFEINNQRFTLNKFEYNPVSQKIIGKREILEGYEGADFIELKGQDNLGNPILFIIKSATNGEVVFAYEKAYAFIEDWSDEITSITLAPFVNGEQVGEEFTIYLDD